MTTCVHCTSQNHPDLQYCETCGGKIRGEELETKDNISCPTCTASIARSCDKCPVCGVTIVKANAADSKSGSADSKRSGDAKREAKTIHCQQCTFEYSVEVDSKCPVCKFITPRRANECTACTFANKEDAKKCEACGCELGPTLTEQFAMQTAKAAQASALANTYQAKANTIGKLLGRYHEGDAELAASLDASFKVEHEERRRLDAVGLVGAPHIYYCPHCNIPLSIDQVNCSIFICGFEISFDRNASTQLPQHNEQYAAERVRQQKARGCGRQFNLNRETNTLVPCTGR